MNSSNSAPWPDRVKPKPSRTQAFYHRVCRGDRTAGPTPVESVFVDIYVNLKPDRSEQSTFARTQWA